MFADETMLTFPHFGGCVNDVDDLRCCYNATLDTFVVPVELAETTSAYLTWAIVVLLLTSSAPSPCLLASCSGA